MSISKVDTATNSASPSTSIAIAKANLSGLSDNDFVFISLMKDDNPGTWVASSGTVGWTITDQATIPISGRINTAIAYKYLTDVSSEPANWSFETTDSEEISAIAIALRGVDSSAPIDASPSHSVFFNDPTPDGEDIITNSGNAWVLTTCQIRSTTVTAFTQPSGFIFDADVYPTNDRAIQCLAHQPQAGAGAVSVGDWAFTDFDVSDDSLVRSIAIKAAPAELLRLPTLPVLPVMPELGRLGDGLGPT